MNTGGFVPGQPDSFSRASTQSEPAIRGLFACAAALIAACVTAIGTSAALGQGCQPEWWAGGQGAVVAGRVNASMMWDPDGPGDVPAKLVIAGAFKMPDLINASGVAAWDPATGEWDALGGGVSNEARSLAVLSDGSLVVGGYFAKAGDVAANNIACWDGTTWSPLGSGMNSSGEVNALQVMADGSLVAGGSFTTAGGVAASKLARWDGAVWSEYAGGLSSDTIVNVLVLRPNGDLVIGGFPDVLRWWDGTSWRATGGRDHSVDALCILPNGDLVVGGGMAIYNGIPTKNLMRFDWHAWYDIGDWQWTPDGAVRSLMVDSNGDLLVGGDFRTMHNVPANRLARWDGQNWSEVDGRPDREVRCMTRLPDGDFIIGGNFKSVGGASASGLARRHGSEWSGFGDRGFNGLIYAAERLRSGDIVVGGEFTSTPSGPANHVAIWNGTRWNPLGDGVEGISVDALAETADGDIIVGGMFEAAGGAPANNIARWDGRSWHTMESGIEFVNRQALVNDVAVMPSGDIIAAGSFNTAGGNPANHIARWDGSAWWPLDTGMGGVADWVFMNSLVVMANGDLVAGGDFTTAGGLPIKYIARWDGTNWWPLGQGLSSQANTFALMPNGDLIAGGLFKTAEGKTVNRIAKWDGATWSPLGAGMAATGTPWVLALDMLPNGELVAGGFFDTAGGAAAKNIAVWDGAAWRAMGDGVDGGVHALAHRTSTDLFVGGEFFQAGGHDSAYFARWACLCPADFNADGFVNGDDYDAFASLFDLADPGADLNHDGFVNGDDYDFFASHFDVGC